MKNGRIAVPSDGSGGLDSKRSEHFGHCKAFTLIDVKDGEVCDVSMIANQDHSQGGCMVPVNILAKLNVNALIVAGIGMRPLQGFNQVGIDVYLDTVCPDVKPVVQNLIAGNLTLMTPGEACGGGGSGQGHGCNHSHE
ncbi:MAG: NifB/NifX family molybdenum-iron cluster-binding protein [Calditrichaeota bacterium]|nr:NifB/NifX family molybdenum-iron cluster-binding protein [Calditrichota bacterium]MBT7618760.1 NifB/NifX family molybdenum-iron cluster-binding protein [Calditrichota bacterium]MBT7787622.1 NifB/NifX family molybdenum-iron cluster-binding protein [Calditrichota bacterium]